MTPEQAHLLARFAAEQAAGPIIRHSGSLVFRSITGSLLIHVMMAAAMLSPVVQLPVTTQPTSMEYFWLTPFFRMDDGTLVAEPEQPLQSSEPSDALPPAAVTDGKIPGQAIELPTMPLERAATAPAELMPADADLVTAAPVALQKKRVPLVEETTRDRIRPPPPVVEQKEIQQEEETPAEQMAPLFAEQERLQQELASREKAEQERRVRDEAARAERERLAIKRQKELEKLAMEKSAAERKLLEQSRLEKLAREAAERERSAREAARRKVEQERLAQEKAQQDKLAREKSEQARLAARANLAEAERQARTQAELDRARQEKVRLEKLSQERIEQERLRIEKARQEKTAREAAERDQKVREERLAYERSVQEKLSAEKAERERKAGEDARLKAEHVRFAREQTEREREAREAAETSRIAELARIGRELAVKNRVAAERTRLEQSAALQAKKKIEEAKNAKPAQPKGIPVPVVNGDMKLAITGDSRISLEVRFRPFPKSRRSRPLTRAESRKESQIVPIMVNKGDNIREAVIEQGREGIYTFIVSFEKPGQNGSFVLTLHDKTSRKSVKKLGKKPVGERAVLTKVLMPEGILWEDEAAFSGSMEDSEGVTKFNSETGLLWKEYGND